MHFTKAGEYLVAGNFNKDTGLELIISLYDIQTNYYYDSLIYSKVNRF
jgi:hypothetical protein